MAMPSVTEVQANYNDSGFSARVFYFTVANRGARNQFGMYLTDSPDGVVEELLVGQNGINEAGQFGIRIYGKGVQDIPYFVKGFAKGGEEAEITSGEWEEYSMNK